MGTIPPKLAQLAADYPDLKIPPPSFMTMQGEFQTYDEANQSITIRFPLQDAFANSLGAMQGGIIGAAIDNTIGPLSFMVADTNVTRTLSVTYHKPVAPPMTHIFVTATFEGQEGRKLRFTATVKDAEGVLLTEADALHIILKKNEG